MSLTIYATGENQLTLQCMPLNLIFAVFCSRKLDNPGNLEIRWRIHVDHVALANLTRVLFAGNPVACPVTFNRENSSREASMNLHVCASVVLLPMRDSVLRSYKTSGILANLLEWNLEKGGILGGSEASTVVPHFI